MGMTFPCESGACRSARDRLPEAVAELRQRAEGVVALRRELPPGGEMPEDYLFHRPDGSAVRVSELFAAGQDILAICSFMPGPDAATPCPMCAGLVDALDGSPPPIRARLALGEIVIGGSPAQAASLADGRHLQWRVSLWPFQSGYARSSSPDTARRPPVSGQPPGWFRLYGTG